MNAGLLLFDPDRISPFIARLVEISLFMLEVHGFLELFRKREDFIHASPDLLSRSLKPVFTYTPSEIDLWPQNVGLVLPCSYLMQLMNMSVSSSESDFRLLW
jgi:hypothetical protein